MEVASALDEHRWSWGGAAHVVEDHLGRPAVRLAGSLEGPHLVTVAGTELEDGSIEADVSIPEGRSFHGLAWRVHDRDHEAFFLRPHQNGHPDAIQYTPVCNGMYAWQLYHGTGFWNAVRFPTDAWFTIRVAFQGEALAVSLAGEPVLHTRLRQPVRTGAFGLIVNGEALHVAEVRFTPDAAVTMVASDPVDREAIRAWEVSEPFAEDDVPEILALGGRTWHTLEAEPSGLTNLARLHPVTEVANTVYVRTTIRADRARRQPLELGFSDRVVVFLNGERLFRGDDSYRSRDHRFLGSMGWYDTLYLPLVAGENELAIAVSEDFGGWGIQARLPS